MSRDHALLWIINVRGVVVESGQCADRTNHDCHRVCVTAITIKETIELRVQHGVVGDRVCVLVEFGFRRELTIGQQVADFQEAGIVGELVDRVAAIEQYAFVAIDVSYLRFTAGCGRKARVECEHTGLGIKRFHIDYIRADSSSKDW